MAKISSKRMGKAVQLDPQLVLPQYPQFPSSFQLIPIKDGVIIHGGEKLQFFNGKNVYPFFSQLLPILNGKNCFEDIYKRLPKINKRSLFNNLALLYSRGLLEDGLGDQGIDISKFNIDILDFFRRHTDTTRVNRSAAEGMNRLLAENITVLSNTTYAKQLQSNLKILGVQNVTLKNWHNIQLQDETFLIVLLEKSINHEDLKRIDNLCSSKGIPWLLSFIGENTGVIGPYFKRGKTACYECFLDLYEKQMVVDTGKSTNPFLTDMWTELTTIEVTYLLTRLLPHQTGSNFNTFTFTDWSKETRRVPRRPGCKHCLEIDGLKPKTPELAIQYENEVNWPSKHLNIPKGHQIHYRANVHQLTHESKEYPNLEHVKLARSEELPIMKKPYIPSIFTDSKTQTIPTKDRIAKILLSGGGWRKDPNETIPKSEKNQRFNPTGGNLGSVQLYLIAEDIVGLRKQLYYYQPKHHSVQPLATLNEIDNLNETMYQITAPLHIPKLKGMIIMTGAYDRVAAKYGAFGYRVIHMDSGAALAQMQGSALSMGISLPYLPQYNEAPITNLLKINFYQEPITGVLLIK